MDDALDDALDMLADLDFEVSEQISNDHENSQLKRDMRGVGWTEAEKTWLQKANLAIGHAAEWAANRLDGIQLGLDGLGMTPVVGIVFDGIKKGRPEDLLFFDF